MHIYSQSGTTITLGGGIGNRQNNVSATNGYTYLRRGGTTHGTLSINAFPFSTITNGTNAPDVIVSGIGSGATSEPGSLLLTNPDTTISAGQDLGILMFGGRDDGSTSYVSSEILGTVFQAPGSGAGGGGILKLRTASASTGASPVTRVLIDNNGKVGVGTSNTTPLATLHVDGTSYFRGESFQVAKTGAIGTSAGIEFLAVGASSGGGQIKIGDVDDYWGGSNSYSTWDTDNETLVHGIKVGINRTPTELLHIWKGSLFIEDSGIRDANGDYGSAGQNLKSGGQNVAGWSWEKQTLVSTFYASSSGSIIYMPVGGTLSETTSNQYYNNFVAPYDGRVRQIRIKNITGTPTATGFTAFRVYVNGSNVSSLAPTVTNGGSNGMMGVKAFDDTDATFSAGDRVQFAYLPSSAGLTAYMYGCTATFIIEYTQNK